MINLTFKKTFIFFSLKAGCELISVIGIVTSCLFISFGILGPIVYGHHFFEEMKTSVLHNPNDYYIYIIYVCVMFLSLFYLIISIGLYIGSSMKLLTLLLPWFYLQLIYIIAVGLIICVTMERLFIAFTLDRFINLLMVVGYMCIKFYFFLCVRSFVIELRLEEYRKNLLANVTPLGYAEYNNL